MGRPGHKAGAILKPLVKLGREAGDCWTWLGSHSADGVPTKTYIGQTMPARRWMWMQMFGPIPDGLVVTTMPTCGNKACINPHHLRCTFQADANRSGDATIILSPADVQEIRRAKKDKGPNTARVLAERIGCSTGAIRDVWSGRSWSAKRAPNHGPNRQSPTGSFAPDATANPPPAP